MKAKILVVDDANTVRMFYRALLSKEGYEVVEARDGSEGLELAVNEVPNLAFIDINMPTVDGYSLVRRLREEPKTRSIPIVMCSTESKPVDEMHAYEAGANFYLRKPVPQELVLQLVAVLGNAK